MPLTPGTTLGPYEIQAPIGAGGMGEVYKARDTRLDRTVAIKVLPEHVASDPDLQQRFEREAKTISSLNHPHICTLYDVGEHEGTSFLVMEYLEGDTLAQRLQKGALPLEQALTVAIEIADALDKAHRQGITHRDLKPGNIMLTKSGAKLLDFGLAKLKPGHDAPVGVSAPTMSAGLTGEGAILGTLQYMAPEQLEGKEADNRSDIFAFGALVYEMVTGKRAFEGESQASLISAIMTADPPAMSSLQVMSPPALDPLVKTCLAKDPDERWQSAGDLGRQLQMIRESGSQPTLSVRRGEAGAGIGAAVGPWNRLTIAMAALSAGLVLTLAVTVVVLTSRPPEQPTPEVVRFSVPIGQDADVYLGGPDAAFGRPSRTSLAFSPDGALLVYSARGGASGLYLQRLEQERAELIEGTEGASKPVFSPDGAWIGFAAGGSGKRVSVADGNIETITQNAGILRGTTWGDDGTVVAAVGRALYQIAATGGDSELLAEALPGEALAYAQPHMLPGSEAVLFHANRSMDPEQAEIVALDLVTGTQKTVLTDAMDPRYLQTGHLLFMRQGTLMAVGFDLERLEVQGQAVIMLEGVMHSLYMPNSGSETGAAQVAVSASGHLAYALGGVYPEVLRTAVRVTSTGDTVPLDMDRRGYVHFRVSPEGNRLAFDAGPGVNLEIWIHDLIRGVAQRLNTGGFSNGPMEWSPDGRWLAFTSDRDGALGNIYRLPADGSGEPERLAPSERHQTIASWSSTGVIAWLEAGDIWLLPPDGSPAPFFTSEANEIDATFSPDGQWLAYRSNRSGRAEIYVRPYPGAEPATLISGDGGINPSWSPDGRQIYYRQLSGAGAGAGVLMAVDVTPTDEFQAGRSAPLIDPWGTGVNPVRDYDVFPDGSFVTLADEDSQTVGDQGAIVARRLEQFGATELHVVLNWTEELKARVPIN